MSRTHGVLVPVVLAMLLVPTWVVAQDAASSPDLIKILSVTSSVLPEKTRVVVETSAPLPLPSSYNLDPLVLVLDIPGTDSTGLDRQYSVASPCIRRLNVYQLEEQGRKSITRLEILMTSLVPYRIFSEGSRLYVDFEHLERTSTPPKVEEFFQRPEPAPAAEPPSKPAPTLSGEIGKIQRIDVKQEGGDLQVYVDFSGRIDYKHFELKSPYRLVLDIINAVNAVPVSTINVRHDPVDSIRVAQFQNGQPKIARVVFDLTAPPQYDIAITDSRLRVTFKGASAAEAVPPDPPASDSENPPVAAGPVVEAAVQPTEPVATDPQPPAEPPAPAVADAAPPMSFSNEPTLTTGDEKGLEMAEVPAPLSVQEPLSAASTGQPEPATAPDQAASGTRFETQTITEGEVTYSGEPINLDLVDAPIEQVFRLISEISGLNVITDPGVSGRVTVHFKGVPWDQALDLILKTNGLGYVLENRVVRIAKLDVLAQEETKKRNLRDAKLLSVDLKTITKSLSYAKVTDMEGVLRKMLSQRGEIITDPRTNTVIVSDIPDRITAINKLIESLDTATPQVTIQAKIVESSSNYTQSLGIQWGFQATADARHGNQTSLSFPNHVLIDGGAVGGTTGLVGPLGGYAVNLPAPAFNSGIGISVGNVLDTFMLDAALTALENSGRGRILSAPKVTTQNNIRASIIQGREIPVQTTANNTTTTTFKNAALELNVTPQITAEGTIIMLVDIKNDQADFANLVNGIPPIITQKALTTVLVRDGGTSVIGGIYRAEDSYSKNNVPYLHKIPILGYLFKSYSTQRTNRELLIFLTPRIVRD
ncbi:MAG: type IV pilus secretin PilQ [Acidobacteriota bacterium]